MTAIYDFFLHNWASNASLEVSFDTNITQSHDSLTEERRARLGRPKRVLTLHWTAVKRSEANRLLMQAMRAGTQQLLVPFAMDQAITTASFTGGGGGSTIPCPTTSRHFEVGQRLVIFSLDADGRPANAQIGTVSGIISGSVTVSENLGTYAAGAIVFPLMLAEIVLTSDLQIVTDMVMDFTITFSEVMETALAGPTSGDSLESQTSNANSAAAGGTPVFNVSPDFSSEVKVSPVRAGTKYALGLGNAFELQGARPSLGFSFNLVMGTHDEAWDLLGFFAGRYGRCVPWWLVNPQTLFEVKATGADTLDVTQDGTLQNLTDFMEYVAVVMKDGTIYVKKVTSIASTGGIWRIAATGLGTLTLADINRVTSAHFVRFDSDALKVDYLTDGVARATIQAREILAETIGTKEDTVPVECGGADDCGGPWSVCVIGMAQLNGFSDCPDCMLGHLLHTFTLDPGVSCDGQTLDVKLNNGVFTAPGSWSGTTNSCVAWIDASIPYRLSPTWGSWVKIFEGAPTTNPPGAGYIYVFVNISRGIGPSTVEALCAAPSSGGEFDTGRIDDPRDFASCPDILVPDDWFVTGSP